MADIQIIIGYETVTQADQAFKILDKTVKSTARQYEQAFSKITSWQKKFSNEQNKVNATLNSNHLAQQRSIKSARDSAKAFEDAARAVEKEAAALRSLRMATDSVYRKQQKRLQMKKLLKSAIVAETMTTEQAIVALKKYNAAQATSNKVMGMAKNRMNGNNMAIQQLGYQFGDFAVQVQGGTSAFVAFSQQGAQLAGILPMIAGPLGLTMGAAVGLSAALGIIIPIVGAVGRLLFETGTKAEEAADKFKGSWSDVPDLFKGLAEGIATPFEEAFDKIEGKYSKLIERFERAKLEAMKSGFQLEVSIGDTKASGMEEFVSGFMKSTRKLLPFGEFIPDTDSDDLDKRRQAQVDEGLRNIEAIVKDADNLESALQQIQVQVEFMALVDKSAADAVSLQLAEQGFIAVAVKATADAKKAELEVEDEKLTKLQRIRSLMGIIEAERVAREKALDDSGDEAILASKVKSEIDLANANAAYEKKMEAEAAALKKRNSKLDAAGDKAILASQAEAEKALLADNAAYEKKMEAEAAALKKRNATLDAAGDKAILASQAEAEKALLEANAKYEADQKALDAAGDKAIIKNNARIELELFAANSKYEAEQAAIRLKEVTELNNLVAGMAERLSIPFAAALNLIRQAKLEATVGVDAFGGRGDFKYEDATTFTPEGFGDDDEGGGGGTNPREELAKYLEVKRQERDLETQLVGILGTEREIQTELFNTKNQYSDVITGKQEKELEGILRLTQAERDRQAVIEEAAAQQEQLVDFIGNSMETAMMGIVDGTVSVKDAFKSMAAEIIKELYRVLVVQQMVAAAKAFFFGGGGGGVTSSPRPPVRPQADGGVFTKVNAYANGGIVSSPTNFPMAGNQVGLMGEAGPEAIMPLKRGSNGKLGVQMEGGGGGDVININQSFNFQANGDETVKKLIAQAAPKIADMAKASVIDSRRRGGSTKAAFG